MPLKRHNYMIGGVMFNTTRNIKGSWFIKAIPLLEIEEDKNNIIGDEDLDHQLKVNGKIRIEDIHPREE